MLGSKRGGFRRSLPGARGRAALTAFLFLLVFGLMRIGAEQPAVSADAGETGISPSDRTLEQKVPKKAKRRAEAPKDTLRGRAVKVQDGDTFDLLIGESDKRRVRVAQIDAPEKKMPFGNKARETFSALVSGKELTVVVNTIDRYGRVVGSVIVDGEDQSAVMIRSGMAWYYRQYGWTDSLARLEDEARAAKIGLWSDPDPEPPWKWRKARRGGKD